jgi:hypothetical protein
VSNTIQIREDGICYVGLLGKEFCRVMASFWLHLAGLYGYSRLSGMRARLGIARVTCAEPPFGRPQTTQALRSLARPT